MSFNFGFPPSSTAPSLGFGTTSANKPGGFGTFGTNTTAPTGFTGFGSNTSAPTGFTGFGATTSAPTGFTGFGATTSAATGFTGFGTTTTTASTGFTGFGTQPAASGGFSFGTSAPTTTTSSNFGFSSGFGTSTAAPSTGFNFGSFGTSNTGTSGGGLFGQTNTGFGGFGSSSFANKATGSFGLGGTGFGQPQQQTSLFGQPQQQQQGGLFGQQPNQLQQLDASEALYSSVFNVQMFGDERDRTLARWNLLQAYWGVGKGYHHPQAPPVEYDMKNPLCQFKAVCYSIRPTSENKDGLVAIVFNKKESEIRSLEQQMISSLNNILGAKPNIFLHIDSIKSTADNKTIVIIYVEDKSQGGNSKRVPANMLTSHLTQPQQKQQLSTLQVENVYAQVDPGQEQLKEYLETPPAGIDARMWAQAQEDNPVPDKLIPVPMIGFQEVRWRLKCQEQETALHQAFLDKVSDEIADLQRKHTATVAKISEHKRRFLELEHRILKVLTAQEINRKMGLSLLPEEEEFKSRIEAIYSTINSAPFKDRLAKLTEGVKSQTDQNLEPMRYAMDPAMAADIKQFLQMEQNCMSTIIDTMQTDITDLKSIKDGLLRIIQ